MWSVAQIPAALLAPALAERRRRWRFWAGLTLACGLAGTLGALLAAEPPVVGPWLWAALMGIGVGAGFPLGLTVIAWRTPDAATSAAARAGSRSASATPSPGSARCSWAC